MRNLAFGFGLLVASCSSHGSGDGVASGKTAAARIEITSAAFAPNGAMAAEYTCEGADVSPPLHFGPTPAGTKSLALVVDDPDAPDPAAPKMTFVHWVVYDLPPTTTDLPSMTAAELDAMLPPGARRGTSDWPADVWMGPCPPIGRHRYLHKLYALDVVLGDLGAPTKAALEKAMAGHVLAAGELVGTYQKTKE